MSHEAGKHVAGMVRANHSLTKLDLDGNDELGKKGIQAICDALKGNRNRGHGGVSRSISYTRRIRNSFDRTDVGRDEQNGPRLCRLSMCHRVAPFRIVVRGGRRRGRCAAVGDRCSCACKTVRFGFGLG